MSRKLGKFRGGKPTHAPKSNRILNPPQPDRQPQTGPTWLNPARGAILDRLKYLDEDWPPHGS
jgi:hypothetical protein